MHAEHLADLVARFNKSFERSGRPGSDLIVTGGRRIEEFSQLTQVPGGVSSVA
jgi:hypothetical protein